MSDQSPATRQEQFGIGALVTAVLAAVGALGFGCYEVPEIAMGVGSALGATGLIWLVGRVVVGPVGGKKYF